MTDAKGTLEFSVKDPAKLTKFRQGSESAEFLSCTQCSVLVGVIYSEGGHTYGAINSVAADNIKFANRKTVSPKKLSASEKTMRWKEIWFPNIRIK